MSSLGGSVPEAGKYQEVDIPVSMLKLDEMNFRTNEVDNQRAAIRAMIDEQGGGLVMLAEHYLQNGLMPGERLIVIPDDTSGEADTFVVMEGNRRTTMLKLLANPLLAKDTSIFSRMNELSRSFEENPRRNLPCVVLPDRRTALVWVEVKHSTGMAGAGVEKWSSPARDRFNEYMNRKFVRWMSALKFLSESGVDISDIQRGITGKTTAVSRVLNAGAMRDILGVRFLANGRIEFENGDSQAGVELLRTMLEEMASSDFSTNDVHSFDDREDFIYGFESLSVKLPERDEGEDKADGAADKDTKQDQPGKSDGKSSADRTDGKSSDGRTDEPRSGRRGGAKDDEGSRGGARGVRRGSRQRSTLASTKRGDELHIKDERLNDIYREARRLKVDKHTSVASVIIRVFVELSCESYLVDRKVPIPDVLSKRVAGKSITWHSFAIKFREKIEACLLSIDPERAQTSLDDVRRGLGAQDQLQSPESLHAYVHGLETIPSARDLIVIWDRYQPLFVAMFS